MDRVLRNARWIGLVLCALLGGVWATKCQAAPLVLRGTATVATAADGLNADLISFSPLPLAASVGDAFEFHLSIDTVNSPGTSPGYAATFSARIGGVDVVDGGLLMQITNDSLIYTEYIAEFIDVDSVGAYGDKVRNYILGDSGRLQSAQSPAFQTNFLFTSSLGLHPSFSSLLIDTGVPDETTTWQSFSQRELALSFDNRSYLGAYITTIDVVPEPSTFSLIGMVIVAFFGYLRSGMKPNFTLTTLAARKACKIVF